MTSDILKGSLEGIAAACLMLAVWAVYSMIGVV